MLLLSLHIISNYFVLQDRQTSMIDCTDLHITQTDQIGKCNGNGLQQYTQREGREGQREGGGGGKR